MVLWWIVGIAGAWCVLSAPAALLIGRIISTRDAHTATTATRPHQPVTVDSKQLAKDRYRPLVITDSVPPQWVHDANIHQPAARRPAR